MQELFKFNEHGDIWQEPELFDAPTAPAETSPETLAMFADHLARTAEHRAAVAELEPWRGNDHPCHFCSAEPCAIPNCHRS